MPTYTRDMPLPKQSLGITQPLVNTNFQTIYDVFAINHYKYDETNFGKHRYIELPVQASIPAGLINNEGTIYTKTANSARQLFYTPDNSGNEYQLTRTISGNYTRFGTNTNYQASSGSNASVTGGWSFLPGGLIIQYGGATTLTPGGTKTIILATAFTTGIYSVVCTPRTSTSIGGGTHDWDVGGLTTTSFDLTINGNYVAGDTFYFNVIGI